MADSAEQPHSKLHVSILNIFLYSKSLALERAQAGTL